MSLLDIRKVAGLALCLALGGCPQLMKDDFNVASSGVGPTAGSSGHATDDAGDDPAAQGGKGERDAGVGGTSGGNTSGACHFTAFAAAERLSGLAVTGEQWSPSLSADSLTLYLSAWDGAANDRLYSATRADRSSNFSAATRLTLMGAVLTPPVSPFVTHDGLGLYFVAAGPNAAVDRDIWVASRASMTMNTFSSPRPLDEIKSGSVEGTPWLSRDELILLFSSTRPNGVGDADIWAATRKGASGPFSPPELVAGVNSGSRDESPVLSNDGLTLFFATTRASTTGKQDIWCATRSTVDEEFGAATPVIELNTEFVETDLVLSSDETEIFFVTDRSGTPQIWRATRECL